MRSKAVGAAAAAIVALSAGWLVGTVPGHHPEPTRTSWDETMLAAAAESTPGDRVRAAIEGLREDGFYIGPELRGELSAAEVARIEQLIAASPVPLFVIWWEETAEAGYYPSSTSALHQVRVGLGVDGFYAALARGRHVDVEALGYRAPFVEVDGSGRPGAAVTRVVTELAAAAATAEPTSDRAPEPPADYWEGAAGGIPAGLMFATGGYLGLLIVIGVSGVVVRRPRTLAKGHR